MSQSIPTLTPVKTDVYPITIAGIEHRCRVEHPHDDIRYTSYYVDRPDGAHVACVVVDETGSGCSCRAPRCGHVAALRSAGLLAAPSKASCCPHDESSPCDACRTDPTEMHADGNDPAWSAALEPAYEPSEDDLLWHARESGSADDWTLPELIALEARQYRHMETPFGLLMAATIEHLGTVVRALDAMSVEEYHDRLAEMERHYT